MLLSSTLLDGLQGHWQFDETSGQTAVDIAGDNDFTFQNDPVFSPAGGRLDGALEFDGVDDRAEAGDVLDPFSGDYSVSLWFKRPAGGTISSDQFLISKGNRYSTREGWSINISDATQEIRLRVNSSDSSAERASTEVDLPLDDQWHHLVMVVDRTSGEVRGYLDGSDVGWRSGGGGPSSSSLSSVTDIDTDDPLTLGAVRDGGNAYNYFEGLLDDARVYDRVLSAEEITLLASGQTTVAPDVSITASSPSVVVGQPYSVYLSSGMTTPERWVIDWGDGVTANHDGDATEVSHKYTTVQTTYEIVATAYVDGVGYEAALVSGFIDQQFNASGTSVIDQGGNTWIRDGVVQADGKLVVVGGPDFTLARYNTDGSLDTTFGGSGIITVPVTGEGQAIALQGDGKILVAGGGGFSLARLNSDGSLDSTFGNGGVVDSTFGSSYEANDLAIQANGSIVLAGDNGYDIVLARFTVDGVLDTSFGSQGDGREQTDIDGGTNSANAMALLADGRIMLAGRSNAAGSTDYDFALVRYTQDGLLDPSFDGDGKLRTDFGDNDEAAFGVAIQPDGKVVVAGRSQQPGTGYDFAVARYNLDGSLDTGFGNNGKVLTHLGLGADYAYDIDVMTNGQLLVTGRASGAGTGTGVNFGIVRYNPDGSLDEGFGENGIVTIDLTGGNDYAEALVFGSVGQAYVVGRADGGLGVASVGILDSGVLTVINNSYVDIPDAVPFDQQHYTLTLLSEGESRAYGLNDNGTVVGVANGVASRFDATGPVALNEPSGSATSVASDITNSGFAIGYAGSGSQSRAFYGNTLLPGIGTGALDAIEADSFNFIDTYVVGWSNGRPAGWYYQNVGGDLGWNPMYGVHFHPNDYFAYATGFSSSVSSGGRAVGVMGDNNGFGRTGGGGFVTFQDFSVFGVLPHEGNSGLQAVGTVLGADNEFRAATTASSFGFIEYTLDLGDWTAAFAMNRVRERVGSFLVDDGTPATFAGYNPSSLSSSGYRSTNPNAIGDFGGFIWFGVNQSYDLNTVSSAPVGNFTADQGFRIESAQDINHSGQIVGFGRDASGTTRGYLLTPGASRIIGLEPVSEFVDFACVDVHEVRTIQIEVTDGLNGIVAQSVVLTDGVNDHAAVYNPGTGYWEVDYDFGDTAGEVNLQVVTTMGEPGNPNRPTTQHRSESVKAQVIDPDDIANGPDTDRDGLSDAFEWCFGLDPNNFDTDGDLLPDGFEVEYWDGSSDELNPFVPNDPEADTDGDGLPDIGEGIHGSDPTNPDTDGDGVSDNQEVEDGADPNDPVDGGVAPPADAIVWLDLQVGDDSGSHHERWRLDVGDIAFNAPDFGRVGVGTYSFDRGETYEVDLSFVARNQDGEHYDETSSITPGGTLNNAAQRAAQANRGEHSWVFVNEAKVNAEPPVFFIIDPVTGDGPILNGGYSGPEDEALEARLIIPYAGITLDSDNNGIIEGADNETEADDTTGHYLHLNTGDHDQNGTPDYADWQIDPHPTSGQPAWFAPAWLSVSENVLEAEPHDEIEYSFTYDASNPTAITEETNSAGDVIGWTLPPGTLRLWKQDAAAARTVADAAADDATKAADDFINAGERLTASELGLNPGEDLLIYVEAVDGSTAPLPITFNVHIDGAVFSTTLTDLTHVVPSDVDLDIDSDNNDSTDWTPTDLEDLIEGGGVGKVLVANTGDRDDNGVRDFADGFTLSGNDSGSTLAETALTPIKLVADLPANDPDAEENPLDGYWVQFDYDDSTPTLDDTALPDGALRLWRTPPSGETRSGLSLADDSAGDFLPSGVRLNAVDLVGDRDGLPDLLVEAIQAVANTPPLDITVTVGFDDGTTSFEIGGDTIRVSIVEPTAPVYSEAVSYLGVGDGSDAGDGVASAILGPVRLDGQSASAAAVDLASDPHASPWGVTRVWSSDPVASLGALAGNGQLLAEAPFLIDTGGSVVVQLGGQTRLVFDRLEDDSLANRFFNNETLTFGGDSYTLKDSAGNTFVFHGFTANLLDKRGRLQSFTSAYGNAVTITYHADDDDPKVLKTLEMTRDLGGVEELWTYTFVTPDPDAEASAAEVARLRPQIQEVTRSRGNTMTGEVTYAYYGRDEDGGEVGDLKSVVIDDQNVQGIDEYAYRYAGTGLNKIMYVLGPDALKRAGTVPTSPAGFLDAGGHKIREKGFQAPGLGDGSSPNTPATGGYQITAIDETVALGPNNTAFTTTIQRHDTRSETFELNHARQVLKHTINAEGTWITDYIYDDQYRLQYINDHTGLVTEYQYHDDGDTPDANRVKRILEAGNVIADFTYQNAGDAIRLEDHTVYTDTGPNPSDTITTTYTYSGGVSNLTVHLPTVTTAQNGSASADTQVFEYDSHGNLIEFTDADDYTRSTSYSFTNNKTTVTLSEPGLANLRMEYDEFGRLTTSTNPSGLVANTSYNGTNATTFHAVTSYDTGDYKLKHVETHHRDTGILDSHRLESTGTKRDHIQTQLDLAGRIHETTQFAYEPDSDNIVTRYAYHASGQLTSTQDPVGDVYTTDYDALDRPVREWINGHLLREHAYDPDTGLLTLTTTHPGAGQDPRPVAYAYDNRNRLTTQTAGSGPDTVTTHAVLDNLGRTTEEHLYQGTTSGTRQALTRTQYDNRHRPFRTERAWVDQTNGNVDTSQNLVTEFWYDARGNVIKQLAPGGLVTKTTYDALGRPTHTYLTNGGGDATHAHATDVANDAVLEQTAYTYNPQTGNLERTEHYQRRHGLADSSTGQLTASTARVTTQGFWYDDFDRLTTTADFGTNTPTPTPPDRPQALVTDTWYHPDGYTIITTDPRGVKTATNLDSVGRAVRVTQAWTGGATGPDNDWHTDTTYDALGRPISVRRSVSGFEDGTGTLKTTVFETQHQYSNAGTTQITLHPDQSGSHPAGGDLELAFREARQFNYLGQLVTHSNRSAFIFDYEYDSLGRLTKEHANSSLSEFDTTTDHHLYTYNAAGQLLSARAMPASGSTPNSEVARTYNGYGQLLSETTDPTGAVGGTGDFTVIYGYENANGGSRPTFITYPDTFTVYYNYAGLDADISRITGVYENASLSNPIETYAYLGLAAPVETRTRLANGDDMLHTVGSGGSYWGLDAFGRVIRDEWHLNTVGSNPLTKFEYGYDNAGNPLYARDQVNPTASELFHNDGAAPNTAYDRLGKRYRYARGTLSIDNRSITTGGLDQPWRTDASGTNERADHAPLNLGRPSFQGDFTAAQLLATIQAWQELDSVGGATPATTLTAVYDRWGRATQTQTWSIGYDSDDEADSVTASQSLAYRYDAL
ncbi:MAG: LamG-like jellyroll fold domain-containing protein, partial [Planctomycetota bacterium]